MATIALQLERFEAGSLAVGQSVVFECNQYSTGNIEYDDTTGIVTFNEAGVYLINWWIAAQSSASNNGAVFELTSSQFDIIAGNSPIKTAEVSGMGIIEVSSAPVTLTLNNASTSAVYLSTVVQTKAMLTVYSVVAATEGISSYCFSMAQLAHVIEQLITLYPESTMSIFNTNLNVVTGTPYQLYTSPKANGPGLFVVLDNSAQPNAVPLSRITALYIGDGTVYDESITYLSPPSPLPSSCDNDLIAAVQDYLPVGTETLLQLGATTQASGFVFKNEYGILVISDADGNTPVFISPTQIARIVTNSIAGKSSGKVSIINQNLEDLLKNL